MAACRTALCLLLDPSRIESRPNPSANVAPNFLCRVSTRGSAHSRLAMCEEFSDTGMKTSTLDDLDVGRKIRGGVEGSVTLTVSAARSHFHILWRVIQASPEHNLRSVRSAHATRACPGLRSRARLGRSLLLLFRKSLVRLPNRWLGYSTDSLEKK